MHGKTTNLSPPDLPAIKRKSWLKLLGVTFQEDATVLTGTSTSTMCYPKRAVECTYLGCANPMDIPRINLIICLTRL